MNNLLNPEGNGVLKVLAKSVKDEAEEYFIQFWYCVNREILQRQFRDLYDALFDRYLPIYEEGKKARVSLQDINEKFELSLSGMKSGSRKENRALRKSAKR